MYQIIFKANLCVHVGKNIKNAHYGNDCMEGG